jgi:hypothetical protein
MNIKKFSLNLSLSLLAISGASSAFAQGNGQLKKDFAAAFQSSEADVDSILQKQAEAMELAGKLTKAIPDDYAGMRINPSKNFYATIYLKSGDASVISQFTTDPMYKIKKAKRSLNELYAILNEVRSILNSNGLNYGAFLDLDMQDIQVSLADPKLAKQLLKGLEGKQLLRIVQEDITLVPTVMAGEASTIGSFGCTTGFSVVHSDGRRGVLTAGHCPNTSMTVGTTSSITYAGTLLNSTDQRDIQWHTKANGIFTSQLKVTGGTTLQVNGEANSTVGSVICMNGVTSGNKCGKIISLSFSGNSYELTAPTTPIPVADGVVIEATTPGTQMCAEGDSGGPIYTTTNTASGLALALGTEFAGLSTYRIGTSTPKKFSRCVYVKTDALWNWNLSLITNVTIP